MDRFLIDYTDTPFRETGTISAHTNRLNWRCEMLLSRNQDLIRGKRVLDLASHDGRFSYACLRLGARHVTGIEFQPELVAAANHTLARLGHQPETFRFLQG